MRVFTDEVRQKAEREYADVPEDDRPDWYYLVAAEEGSHMRQIIEDWLAPYRFRNVNFVRVFEMVKHGSVSL